MFGWRLHAWCLMGTHYHLLVEAPRERLSHGMHRLNGLYAQRFNRRHGQEGAPVRGALRLLAGRRRASTSARRRSTSSRTPSGPGSARWRTRMAVELAATSTRPRRALAAVPLRRQVRGTVPRTVARPGGVRTTCTSPGPCTPTTSCCSMSALRLGPVTIASALGRSSPTASNSSARPGRIRSSAQQRHVDGRQQRPSARLLGATQRARRFRCPRARTGPARRPRPRSRAPRRGAR